MQAELSERVRQQQISTELIANLSHDLKTPVAIISGYAEGLQEGVARTPEQQQTYYSMILKESEHMQELIWKLLAQSRLDSGEIPLEIEEFDLADLLDDAPDAFQREIERLELAVERDYSHPTPVRSDYESIRQSVGNYVQNAVLHINGGNRVRISTERRGALIRLHVANSSAPIPAEEAKKIWNRLYRGDPARQRHRGEAGLGLSIVKGNMDRLGLACGQQNLDGMVDFWLDIPDAAGDLPPAPGVPSDT
jgi:signal transduction histidine kinase